MAIQWRPEQNSLTNPLFYRARVIPKDSLGYRKLAERIVQKMSRFLMRLKKQRIW